MNRSLPVRVSASARRQIRDAASWWRTNRAKAPSAVRIDLGEALELLGSQPEIGSRAEDSDLAGIRRLSLPRFRYWIYYRVDPGSEFIEILALWHTSRGGPPDIVQGHEAP